MSKPAERMVFLDTETTGLDAGGGDRIVEIGAVACIDRRLQEGDEGVFHQRVDPEREVPAEAVRIHGITTADLKGKPKFRDVAADLVEFIRGAEVVIHNAAFDCGFLDRELAGAGLPPLADIAGRITDSLKAARLMHPGCRNDLDSLCLRLGMDVRMLRRRHSALVDAQLLGRAYLLMTGGQRRLMLDSADGGMADNSAGSSPIEAIPWKADKMSIKANSEYLARMQERSGVSPIMLSWSAD